MSRAPCRSVLVALLALAVAGCAPCTDAPSTGVTTTVVLPSLERCLHVGTAAPFQVGGERLAWACEAPRGEPRGLVGAPTVRGAEVAWRLVATVRAAGGALSVASDEVVAGTVRRLTLATGETCVLGDAADVIACGGDLVVVDVAGDDAGLVALVAPSAEAAPTGRPVRVASVQLE